MKNYLFLLYSIIFFTHCGDPMPDPEPMLPPITLEGKNTLGFLLNGQVWLPEVPFPDLSGSIRLACGISLNTKDLVVHTTRFNDSMKQTLIFGIDSISSIGDYKFNSWKNIFIDQKGQCITQGKDFSYDIDTLKPNKFIVNFIDYNQQIISGSFIIYLTNFDCIDSLEISEGRYDLKFNWVP